jgi:pyridinium-3,5-biscarboxylic acid mononucleotide sulfurtransferase
LTVHQRIAELKDHIEQLGGAAVAFSGGVDSTFLLAVAKLALGDNLVAIIGKSHTYPARELRGAIDLAKTMGVAHKVVETCELDDPEFSRNPPHRCYICKSSLLKMIIAEAQNRGLPHVIEGSNADDTGDFRPGLEAVRKLGIGSPLRELGFTKAEIRSLSKELDLPTWDKPALACLASRIPYGQSIDQEQLAQIEKAENALQEMGLQQFRVRHHGTLARIEVPPGEISALVATPMREELVAALKEAGYQYISLDLQGYRTGAMNEVLSAGQQAAAENQD